MSTERDVAANVDGEEIVIRIRMPKVALEPNVGADRLIRLEQTACDAAGFELNALRSKVKTGELPCVRIGRASYVRMSDLCALVKTKPAAEPRAAEEPGEDDQSYARLVASPRRGRRRCAS